MAVAFTAAVAVEAGVVSMAVEVAAFTEAVEAAVSTVAEVVAFTVAAAAFKAQDRTSVAEAFTAEESALARFGQRLRSTVVVDLRFTVAASGAVSGAESFTQGLASMAAASAMADITMAGSSAALPIGRTAITIAASMASTAIPPTRPTTIPIAAAA